MAAVLGVAPHLRGAADAAPAAKLYVLDMFPYPSGDGLHVGHMEGQTATDIVCRFARMHGRCVLHPMGWDAFGLPAEQYAKKTGTPPRITTEKNISTFRRQEKMLGFSYDWDRELATTDVEYFRWTQWIFLVLFDTWYDSSPGAAGRSPNCRFPPTCKPPARRPCAATRTGIAWPTSPRRRSTGARPWALCWPTRK